LPEPSLADAIANNEKLRTDNSFRTAQKETWATNAKDHYNSFIEEEDSDSDDSPSPFLWTLISFLSMVIAISILRSNKKR
jgi:hypothetical protein